MSIPVLSYSGLAIALLQIVSACLLIPLFPTRPEHLQDGTPGPTIVGFLGMILVTSTTTCVYWLIIICTTGSKSKSSLNHPSSHIALLACAAVFWLYLGAGMLLMRMPTSPFWRLISACADAPLGFATNLKCASIGAHTFILPIANILICIEAAWKIYRSAFHCTKSKANLFEGLEQGKLSQKTQSV
ncbi:hypothetical protein FB45DRAFT_923790 [Roridomyces roridus]|uniref:Uncharacterized protein n=1 Tax=Roridomyces roridus TaxID=1738132 RepID=A0AAD7BLR8_9AGAR|nr:hypothetical protein FB45DRAFT_923790 [Roridomyces roridus]